MCICDNVVCERWCVTKRCVKDGVAKDGVTKLCAKDGVVKDGVYQTLCWGLLACPFCTNQSPHASVTRECHKHCQVSNVTQTLYTTIEMKRRTFQHNLQIEKTWQHLTAEATADSLLATIFPHIFVWGSCF